LFAFLYRERGGTKSAAATAITAGPRATLARQFLPEPPAVALSGDGGELQNQPAWVEWRNDARTGMPRGIPRGAMCVQRLDDSLKSAIHASYRISLRSSSMPEPRDPLLKVVLSFFCKSVYSDDKVATGFAVSTGGRLGTRQGNVRQR
jgi:hypothetical protein